VDGIFTKLVNKGEAGTPNWRRGRIVTVIRTLRTDSFVSSTHFRRLPRWVTVTALDNHRYVQPGDGFYVRAGGAGGAVTVSGSW
jgi:hypothetical protein